MSSGVRFIEEYRENDDVSRLVVAFLHLAR
jgi:hypothetical protein